MVYRAFLWSMSVAWHGAWLEAHRHIEAYVACLPGRGAGGIDVIARSMPARERGWWEGSRAEQMHVEMPYHACAHVMLDGFTRSPLASRHLPCSCTAPATRLAPLRCAIPCTMESQAWHGCMQPRHLHHSAAHLMHGQLADLALEEPSR